MCNTMCSVTEQGWNDPPTLAFENTPKTGANKLTKHPRYSADRAPTTSTHPPPQATLDVTSGPPPTLNISSPPQKEGSCNTKADVDANNDFGAVVQLLEKQVNDLQDTLQVGSHSCVVIYIGKSRGLVCAAVLFLV